MQVTMAIMSSMGKVGNPFLLKKDGREKEAKHQWNKHRQKQQEQIMRMLRNVDNFFPNQYPDNIPAGGGMAD